MPDGISRVPLPPEMDIFNAEIGCDQNLVSGAGTQNGAVIANSTHHGFVYGSAGQPADLLDQLPLFHFVASLPTACELGRLWFFRRL
jgi:hypothetical protein